MITVEGTTAVTQMGRSRCLVWHQAVKGESDLACNRKYGGKHGQKEDWCIPSWLAGAIAPVSSDMHEATMFDDEGLCVH